YQSSFHGEIAEDPSVMRKALRYTNMPGFAKKAARMVARRGEEDVYLVVFKDESIQGKSQDKIVGMQTFSYYPDKNFAVSWYLAIDPAHRGRFSPSSMIESIKKKVEEYASRYGKKPLGLFGEIEHTNTKMAHAMERYAGMKKLEGMNYLCHPFREGERPTPASLYFLRMGEKSASLLTPDEKIDIVKTIYSRGYSIKKVDKDPVFQQVVASINKRKPDASSYQPRRPA
ncbi:MAG: hypothetical protein V1731_01630, partial [Candidatus Aenigmatarchaeota archaeon]